MCAVILIRRRTANGILPLSLLSSRSLLSPRCQLQTCEFPLLNLSSLSLPLISILATPMQPCSAFLPPALPPHSNSSSWSWQHRTLGGVEGEDTEQGARVGWPCSPALGLLLLPFLLSFPLTSALCPGGAGRRVEWRGKTRSKVQEWALVVVVTMAGRWLRLRLMIVRVGRGYLRDVCIRARCWKRWRTVLWYYYVQHPFCALSPPSASAGGGFSLPLQLARGQ